MNVPPWLTKVARTVLAVAAALVLLWVGRRNAVDLRRVHLRLRITWLVASLPLSVCGGLLLAVGWRAELDAFGHRLPVRLAIRLWWRAQLARYVPSGLAAFASRAALARKEGVPPKLGAGSLAMEIATLIGWGTLGASLGVPMNGWLRALLLGGSSVGLVALPFVSERVVAATPARRVVLYEAIGAYGLSILVKSAAFVLFSAALVSIRASDAWLLGGAIQGAAVIGIVGITPAGIGVRETALVGLLSHRLGSGDALALAVGWRAYEFAFELAWLGIGSLWRREHLVATP